MIPLLRMLDLRGLSLSDAESGGYEELAQAAQRCNRCRDTDACIRWIKWRGRGGRHPFCANVRYFEYLGSRARRR